MHLVTRPLTFLIVAVLLCTATACASSTTALPTPGVSRATVTDSSVPFTSSEADALVPRGFLGQGAFGRLGRGCTVEVLKTTDRAAQVRAVSCPPGDGTTVEAQFMGPNGLQGWVAKSALDLR